MNNVYLEISLNVLDGYGSCPYCDGQMFECYPVLSLCVNEDIYFLVRCRNHIDVMSRKSLFSFLEEVHVLKKALNLPLVESDDWKEWLAESGYDCEEIRRIIRRGSNKVRE